MLWCRPRHYQSHLVDEAVLVVRARQGKVLIVVLFALLLRGLPLLEQEPHLRDKVPVLLQLRADLCQNHGPPVLCHDVCDCVRDMSLPFAWRLPVRWQRRRAITRQHAHKRKQSEGGLRS